MTFLLPGFKIKRLSTPREHTLDSSVYEFLILIWTNDSDPTFFFRSKRLKLRTWPRFVEIYLITGSRDKLKLIDFSCGWKKLRNREACRLGSCFHDEFFTILLIPPDSRRDVQMDSPDGNGNGGMKGSLIRIDCVCSSHGTGKWIYRN